MELEQAIKVLDDEGNKHWLYKQASAEVETAVAVVLATARVVHEERQRLAALRKERK